MRFENKISNLKYSHLLIIFQFSVPLLLYVRLNSGNVFDNNSDRRYYSVEEFSFKEYYVANIRG